MYSVAAGKSAVAPPIGRGKARGAEFVRGAHQETELRKKLKPTQPANSSVRPWKGGVPIYKVQFGGGANYLLASNMRTALVALLRDLTPGYIYSSLMANFHPETHSYYECPHRVASDSLIRFASSMPTQPPHSHCYRDG